MISALKNLLKQDKEQEILQSFVRIEPEKEPTPQTSHHHKQLSVGFADVKKLEKKVVPTKSLAKISNKLKTKEVFNETYTDKDRAAAVSAGSFDIKQSLQLKKQIDRNEVLQLTDDADCNSLISLGLKEIKNANIENAIICFTKALELNKVDVNALVARSKCYLVLGEAAKALADAELAMNEDANNMRAMYQKAESLYYLGQFEESLMFFYRALRARPEFDSIRLGVQKTQEAIRNTIITSKKVQPLEKTAIRKTPSPTNMENKGGRILLGELKLDKDYLENLLQNPDLKKANKSTENVTNLTEEAVVFLDKREVFWRQQRPCGVLSGNKSMPQDAIPYWF